jgi:hexosaminidase
VAGPSLSAVNLAAGKKASASSNYSDAFDARFATDGNPETRWNAAVGEKSGAWLEVDFGQPTRFNRVIVRQLDQRITNYKIQYLESAEWRDACNGGAEPTVSFPSVQASKMRLLVVSANPEPSVFELEVYDDKN